MLNYYATKPTDYQAYSSDSAIRESYDALFQTTDDVIAGVKILSAENADSNAEVSISDRAPSSDLYVIAGNNLFSFECGAEWYTKSVGGAVLASKTEESDAFDLPQISISPITIEGNIGEEVVKIKNAYLDTYQNRIAGTPEVIMYEVPGTDRRLGGIRVKISSEDGMETITREDLLEEQNGQIFEYSCAYISSEHAEGKHEDETTYFEFMHAVDTMEFYLQ